MKFRITNQKDVNARPEFECSGCGNRGFMKDVKKTTYGDTGIVICRNCGASEEVTTLVDSVKNEIVFA